MLPGHCPSWCNRRLVRNVWCRAFICHPIDPMCSHWYACMDVVGFVPNQATQPLTRLVLQTAWHCKPGAIGAGRPAPFAEASSCGWLLQASFRQVTPPAAGVSRPTLRRQCNALTDDMAARAPKEAMHGSLCAAHQYTVNSSPGALLHSQRPPGLAPARPRPHPPCRAQHCWADRAVRPAPAARRSCTAAPGRRCSQRAAQPALQAWRPRAAPRPASGRRSAPRNPRRGERAYRRTSAARR